MKKQTVIKFTWGALPADALNPQTMRELRVIANRQGSTIEQVMSKALHWSLATPERSARSTSN
jgi:hypothetical protein